MKFFTVAIHFHEGKVWNVDMLNRPPAAEEKYVKYINNLTYEQAEDLYRIISGDSQRRELSASMWKPLEKKKEEKPPHFDRIMQQPGRMDDKPLHASQLPWMYPDER
jgi:hypothetical protein